MLTEAGQAGVTIEPLSALLTPDYMVVDSRVQLLKVATSPHRVGFMTEDQISQAMLSFCHETGGSPCAIVDIGGDSWLYTRGAMCELCQMRRCGAESDACTYSDYHAAWLTYRTSGPSVYQCPSLGVVDYAIPMRAIDGGGVASVFIAGQFQHLWANHITIGNLGAKLDAAKVLRAYYKMRLLDQKAIDVICGGLAHLSSLLKPHGVEIAVDDIEALRLLLVREIDSAVPFAERATELAQDFDDLYRGFDAGALAIPHAYFAWGYKPQWNHKPRGQDNTQWSFVTVLGNRGYGSLEYPLRSCAVRTDETASAMSICVKALKEIGSRYEAGRSEERRHHRLYVVMEAAP